MVHGQLISSYAECKESKRSFRLDCNSRQRSAKIPNRFRHRSLRYLGMVSSLCLLQVVLDLKHPISPEILQCRDVTDFISNRSKMPSMSPTKKINLLLIHGYGYIACLFVRIHLLVCSYLVDLRQYLGIL